MRINSQGRKKKRERTHTASGALGNTATNLRGLGPHDLSVVTTDLSGLALVGLAVPISPEPQNGSAITKMKWDVIYQEQRRAYFSFFQPAKS